MKFKEALDGETVIYQDPIEKIFDFRTSSTCIELEKTMQEFWNVDRASANFLNMLIQITNSKNALEIGTSNGYSAIWLAKALRQTGGKLTTIEFWQKRVDMALINFEKAGVKDLITTITGDAIEILAKMNADYRAQLNAPGANPPVGFDFVFIDANKAEYIEYFSYFDELLENGGVIVADNILSHRKKTKNYVEKLMSREDYRSQLLNFEAGMLLSYKRKKA